MYTNAYRQEFEDALRLVAEKHSRQMRKGTRVPYITHLVQVCSILQEYDFPTEVCVAGLLHDIVEDQNVSLDEIEADFGSRVADMVGSVTERKTDRHNQPRSWAARKREALMQLRHASQEAVAVKAADTLHNVRTITLDVRREGPSVWLRFNGQPRWMLYVYRQVARVTQERLPDHPLAAELAEAVEDLANAIALTVPEV